MISSYNIQKLSDDTTNGVLGLESVLAISQGSLLNIPQNTWGGSISILVEFINMNNSHKKKYFLEIIQ